MITDAAQVACWRASLEIAATGKAIETIEIEFDRRSARHGIVRSMRIEFVGDRVEEGEEEK